MKSKSTFFYLYRDKRVKWIFIPLILILLWFFLALFFNPYSNFFSLTYNTRNAILTNFKTNKFSFENVLEVSFKARENDLGTVLVRFKNTNGSFKKQKNLIRFRIKEKNAPKWYYVNEYNSSIVSSLPMFPFGFPTIHDSLGKLYVFEISSQNISVKKAIEIKGGNLFFQEKYIFNRKEILFNPKEMATFLYKKIYNLFTNREILFASLLFLLPLLLYLFIAVFIGLFKLPLKKILVLSIFLSFFIAAEPRFYFFGFAFLTLIWLFLSFWYKYKSFLSFLVSFVFLLSALIFALFNLQQQVNYFSNLGYVTLLIGTIQMFMDLNKHKI